MENNIGKDAESFKITLDKDWLMPIKDRFFVMSGKLGESKEITKEQYESLRILEKITELFNNNITENKYVEYKGFWIKYISEGVYWKISLNEDDSCCSVWHFCACTYSLDEAINNILKNPDTIEHLQKGYELLPETFINFVKTLENDK